MTQTDNSFTISPASSSAAASPLARVLWTALILATLYLCYFHNLGSVGFVGPDEPRYAWIARDMAETGNWVTPRLYGKPWFEKPVLYYWGAALSFKLFGTSETAARLPSAISALLATLAMAWLAWKLYGGETARWLLLLLPTTVGMIGFSHAAATDMPFSGMLTDAMLFVAVIVGLTRNEHSPVLPRTPWLALILFGSFLGLAVLAKGPAAIILSGCSVLLWAAFTKRWRDAFRCLHPVAIAAFCFTALPWYILCARRNPDFFRVFIIEHNFKRFLTPEFQHIQPFWYYLPIVLLATFPWTILLLSGLPKLMNLARDTASAHASTLFFLSWSLFTIFFFSISKSKLPGYVLPALPALAILLARHVTQLLRDNMPSSRWIFSLFGLALFFLGAGFGVALFAGSYELPLATDTMPNGVIQLLAITVLGGLTIFICSSIRKLSQSLLAICLVTLLLVMAIGRLLPLLDGGVSARTAAGIAQQRWPEFTAQQSATWQLNRSYVYQLNYYLRSELVEWKADAPKPEWLFIKYEKREEAAQQGFDCGPYIAYPAVLPCHRIISVRGLQGLSGNGGSGNSVDRQPR
jgi:4-amino-4-deoxy-L-arabinose transferase-like glycosyltransferase